MAKRRECKNGTAKLTGAKSSAEEIWALRIKECRESGISVQAWCREQGQSYHTYYKWQQRLYHKLTEPENGFYEISENNRSKAPAVTVQIGIVTADIYNGADEATVCSVLRA